MVIQEKIFHVLFWHFKAYYGIFSCPFCFRLAPTVLAQATWLLVLLKTDYSAQNTIKIHAKWKAIYQFDD